MTPGIKLTNRFTVIVVGITVAIAAAGCGLGTRNPRLEPYGKIYYLDGAGNIGYGRDMPRMLHDAGFDGDVVNITWTSFTGPLGDQLIRINAREKAKMLAKKMIKYRRRYSQTPLHVIGLSAGTGVSVWSVEALPPGMTVDNMVLLGSSLSSTYDMTHCLRRVEGKVYVLVSARDVVLIGFVPVTGTIDGQWFVQPAGLIGLVPPAGSSPETIRLYREKIVNIDWEPGFARLGNIGGHTDGTSRRFVKEYIAPELLGIKLAGEAAGESEQVKQASSSPSSLGQ